MNNSPKFPIYENIEVYSPEPDSQLMFRSSRKRASWYLDHDLAEKIEWGDQPGDRRAIRLTFKPRGLGNACDPYYSQVQKNRCVVCGSEENLQHHHVVPFCYRKHFPMFVKDHSHHDILAVCDTCKRRYAPAMNEFMDQLARQFKVEPSGQFAHKAMTKLFCDALVDAKIAACALVGPHKDKIPLQRKAVLRRKVEQVFGYLQMDQAGLRWVAQLPPVHLRTAGEVVAGEVVKAVRAQGNVKDVQSVADALQSALIQPWRAHFVRHNRPKYLPEHWSITRAEP